MGNAELQLRFDEGRQQRYFSDRRGLLECVLRVGAQSPHPRFEVFDLSEQGQRERLAAELHALETGGEPR